MTDSIKPVQLETAATLEALRMMQAESNERMTATINEILRRLTAGGL